MIKVASPEVALGTSRMAYTGFGGTERVITETVRNAVQNDNRTTITGNTFIVRQESDIERIAQELDRLRRRKARGLGVAVT